MDTLKQYGDEVRVRRALAVLDYQVEHGASIQEACEACNVPHRTFNRWVKDGLLAEYLDACREGRLKVLRLTALNAVESVMRYMIKIATGEKIVRGANPIAAAKFVFEMAGLGPATERPQPPSTVANVLVGMPQQVVFNIKDGMPVTDPEGRPIVIDV